MSDPLAPWLAAARWAILVLLVVVGFHGAFNFLDDSRNGAQGIAGALALGCAGALLTAILRERRNR